MNMKLHVSVQRKMQCSKVSTIIKLEVSEFSSQGKVLYSRAVEYPGSFYNIREYSTVPDTFFYNVFQLAGGPPDSCAD
jgi:hypothetical protein